jgi:hypothetical protein
VKAEPSDSELIRVGDIKTHYKSSDERRDTNSTDRDLISDLGLLYIRDSLKDDYHMHLFRSGRCQINLFVFYDICLTASDSRTLPEKLTHDGF